jgi:GTPase
LKKAAGVAPLIVSAASGEGVPEVLRALAAEIDAVRTAEKAAPAREPGWQP